eukprot:scaffold37622_cov199-Amphora_coffeaeformis.AAC.1
MSCAKVFRRTGRFCTTRNAQRPCLLDVCNTVQRLLEKDQKKRIILEKPKQCHKSLFSGAEPDRSLKCESCLPSPSKETNVNVRHMRFIHRFYGLLEPDSIFSDRCGRTRRDRSREI